MAAAVADPGRPEADRARDANRHPAEAVAFAGVKPGDKVAELISAGGYYTRILAKAVGPNGRVYALMPAALAARPGMMDGLNAIAAAYPNVTVVATDLTSFTLPEKVDLVWTTENYHDLHNGPAPNIAGVDKAVFDALKPGGTFYVEDHSAAPGAGLEATSKFHRMDEAVAKKELAEAGFHLEAESDLLRNPADNRNAANAEGGHFTSDRFMLRLKRP